MYERMTPRAERSFAPAAPIVGLLRNDPANPPARIGPVAAIPGDDMHMHVHDGLAGRRAIIDADVVPVRPQRTRHFLSFVLRRLRRDPRFEGLLHGGVHWMNRCVAVVESDKKLLDHTRRAKARQPMVISCNCYIYHPMIR